MQVVNTTATAVAAALVAALPAHPVRSPGSSRPSRVPELEARRNRALSVALHSATDDHRQRTAALSSELVKSLTAARTECDVLSTAAADAIDGLLRQADSSLEQQQRLLHIAQAQRSACVIKLAALGPRLLAQACAADSARLDATAESLLRIDALPLEEDAAALLSGLAAQWAAASAAANTSLCAGHAELEALAATALAAETAGWLAADATWRHRARTNLLAAFTASVDAPTAVWPPTVDKALATAASRLLRRHTSERLPTVTALLHNGGAEPASPLLSVLEACEAADVADVLACSDNIAELLALEVSRARGDGLARLRADLAAVSSSPPATPPHAASSTPGNAVAAMAADASGANDIAACEQAVERLAAIHSATVARVTRGLQATVGAVNSQIAQLVAFVRAVDSGLHASISEVAAAHRSASAHAAVLDAEHSAVVSAGEAELTTALVTVGVASSEEKLGVTSENATLLLERLRACHIANHTAVCAAAASREAETHTLLRDGKHRLLSTLGVGEPSQTTSSPSSFSEEGMEGIKDAVFSLGPLWVLIRQALGQDCMDEAAQRRLAASSPSPSPSPSSASSSTSSSSSSSSPVEEGVEAASTSVTPGSVLNPSTSTVPEVPSAASNADPSASLTYHASGAQGDESRVQASPASLSPMLIAAYLCDRTALEARGAATAVAAAASAAAKETAAIEAAEATAAAAADSSTKGKGSRAGGTGMSGGAAPVPSTTSVIPASASAKKAPLTKAQVAAEAADRVREEAAAAAATAAAAAAEAAAEAVVAAKHAADLASGVHHFSGGFVDDDGHPLYPSGNRILGPLDVPVQLVADGLTAHRQRCLTAINGHVSAAGSAATAAAAETQAAAAAALEEAVAALSLYRGDLHVLVEGRGRALAGHAGRLVRFRIRVEEQRAQRRVAFDAGLARLVKAGRVAVEGVAAADSEMHTLCGTLLLAGPCTLSGSSQLGAPLKAIIAPGMGPVAKLLTPSLRPLPSPSQSLPTPPTTTAGACSTTAGACNTLSTAYTMEGNKSMAWPGGEGSCSDTYATRIAALNAAFSKGRRCAVEGRKAVVDAQRAVFAHLTSSREAMLTSAAAFSSACVSADAPTASLAAAAATECGAIIEADSAIHQATLSAQCSAATSAIDAAETASAASHAAHAVAAARAYGEGVHYGAPRRAYSAALREITAFDGGKEAAIEGRLWELDSLLGEAPGCTPATRLSTLVHPDGGGGGAPDAAWHAELRAIARASFGVHKPSAEAVVVAAPTEPPTGTGAGKGGKVGVVVKPTAAVSSSFSSSSTTTTTATATTTTTGRPAGSGGGSRAAVATAAALPSLLPTTPSNTPPAYDGEVREQPLSVLLAAPPPLSVRIRHVVLQLRDALAARAASLQCLRVGEKEGEGARTTGGSGGNYHPPRPLFLSFLSLTDCGEGAGDASVPPLFSTSGCEGGGIHRRTYATGTSATRAAVGAAAAAAAVAETAETGTGEGATTATSRVPSSYPSVSDEESLYTAVAVAIRTRAGSDAAGAVGITAKGKGVEIYVHSLKGRSPGNAYNALVGAAGRAAAVDSAPPAAVDAVVAKVAGKAATPGLTSSKAPATPIANSGSKHLPAPAAIPPVQEAAETTQVLPRYLSALQRFEEASHSLQTPLTPSAEAAPPTPTSQTATTAKSLPAGKAGKPAAVAAVPPPASVPSPPSLPPPLLSYISSERGRLISRNSASIAALWRQAGRVQSLLPRLASAVLADVIERNSAEIRGAVAAVRQGALLLKAARLAGTQAMSSRARVSCLLCDDPAAEHPSLAAVETQRSEEEAAALWKWERAAGAVLGEVLQRGGVRIMHNCALFIMGAEECLLEADLLSGAEVEAARSTLIVEPVVVAAAATPKASKLTPAPSSTRAVSSSSSSSSSNSSIEASVSATVTSLPLKRTRVAGVPALSLRLRCDSAQEDASAPTTTAAHPPLSHQAGLTATTTTTTTSIPVPAPSAPVVVVAATASSPPSKVAATAKKTVALAVSAGRKSAAPAPLPPKTPPAPVLVPTTPTAMATTETSVALPPAPQLCGAMEVCADAAWAAQLCRQRDDAWAALQVTVQAVYEEEVAAVARGEGAQRTVWQAEWAERLGALRVGADAVVVP